MEKREVYLSAIREMTKKSGTDEKSEDALRQSQSALNLAHVMATLDNLK